jgi:predicted GNAT family acetyltransferase
VAFIIGIPNMAQGLREAKGRLFPFGVFKILRATRKTKQLDLYLGGIKEEVRGKGLDVMMGKKMIESCQKAGIEFMDSHHELEGNLKMRSEMERLGSEVYKRYRIFQKSLKT